MTVVSGVKLKMGRGLSTLMLRMIYEKKSSPFRKSLESMKSNENFIAQLMNQINALEADESEEDRHEEILKSDDSSVGGDSTANG